MFQITDCAELRLSMAPSSASREHQKRNATTSRCCPVRNMNMALLKYLLPTHVYRYLLTFAVTVEEGVVMSPRPPRPLSTDHEPGHLTCVRMTCQLCDKVTLQSNEVQYRQCELIQVDLLLLGPRGSNVRMEPSRLATGSDRMTGHYRRPS
ncbi:hypothetical protein F2P81_005268 [Scophthalmus maximus]|uniref:Uncharacterized protein n=1 Tax=Scophthalmus maximus TaxID=52904 RepID=A0A6A4T2N5_SCOMX|nr:hypothetical protein F2P81_005268 [Scophthalmus maximus]